MKMMKQQPYATHEQPSEYRGLNSRDSVKRPSRLCKFLLALLGFKIGLLGVVMFEPVIDLGFVQYSAQEVATTWQNNFGKAQGQDSGMTPETVALEASVQKMSATVAETSAKVKAETTAANMVQAQNAPKNTAFRRAPGIAFAATPVNVPQASQGGATSNLSLDALTRKQEELTRKEQDLKSLQAELDSRFQQMQDLEMRLKIMLKDAEEMKDARYRQLVDVLSNMKARQAAEVLSTLDEKIAVRVLAGMRGRSAGEILSLADPVKAARLAEALSRMQMPLE
jgi:flagellar motility protein MotE (MotC chaperone)